LNQIWQKSVKNVDAIVNERRDSRKPKFNRLACAVTITVAYITDHNRLTWTFGIYWGLMFQI